VDTCAEHIKTGCIYWTCESIFKLVYNIQIAQYPQLQVVGENIKLWTA